MQVTTRPLNVLCYTVLAGIALLASSALAVPEESIVTPLGQSVHRPPPLPALPREDTPVKRVIVDAMTPFLHQTLQQHNITLLLVLPGPSSDSNTAQSNSSVMKVDWNKLTGVQQVNWIYSYQEFMAKWHWYVRHWHSGGGGFDMQQITASNATDGSTTGAYGQQRQKSKPAVALLV